MSHRVELKVNPFPFILSKGDPVSILQILAPIDRLRTKPGFNSLTSLISAQNVDGGFPRDLKKNAPSSVKMTYRALRVLHRVGVDKRSHVFASALGWLLDQRSADGGWHENPSVALPEWMTWESTIRSVTWYTCQIGILLRELNMQDTDVFRKIVAFFEKSELPSGGWGAVVGINGHDDDSTVGIGDFIAQAAGDRHPAVARAQAVFESGMAKLIAMTTNERTDDAYDLTHLIFENPQNSMYKKEDERVVTVLKALIEAQREDGGWLTFYSEGKSDVPITVFSLQVLVSHGLLDRVTLQEMFDASSK